MNDTQIIDLYTNKLPQLCDGDWKEWRASYLRFVERVQGARHDEWMKPEFQKYLWESDEASNLGMGSSVTVPTAYADPEVAEALWSARNLSLPDDPDARGDVIARVFEDVIKLVTPKHNTRRPSSRLVRLLAGVFPRSVLCLLNDDKTKQVRSLLQLKKQGDHFLKQHERVRQRLRAIVGDESTLEASVERSLFSWLLYVSAADNEEQVTGAAAPSVLPPPTVAGSPTAPPLRLFPRTQQYLGISHVKDALRILLTIVRDAQQGISRKDLISNIQSEAPYLSAKSAGIQISIARERLGLIELNDREIFRPTPIGRELLDGETPSSVLAPVLLRGIWGFAQLFDALRRNAGGLSSAAIGAELRARHGTWETDMTAGAILDWCRELELVDEDESPSTGALVFSLSESGAQWAGRLPTDLTAWDAPAATDTPTKTADAVGAARAEPTLRVQLVTAEFDDVAKHFALAAPKSRLLLPPDLLALLHGALHATPHKRFVLLSGLSGTGKTSLAEAYARAYCAARGVPASEHMLRVPVSPDWSDPSGLLGYISPLGPEPSFQGTQTLELLMLAARNTDKPYFLCLDEMNLARVEHYFAPFLSAMEGSDTELFLHGSRDTVDNVPSKIPWPRNLFILGTVNMDETTHAFSDKVLDRAFSFELWDVDLPAWRARALDAGAEPATLDQVFAPLQALYAALHPARRHFGYRTCDEILGFCSAVPPTAQKSAIDAAVMAKILPKIRGDDSGPLPAALTAVADVCKTFALVRSGEKVEALRQSLSTLGIARFSA